MISNDNYVYVYETVVQGFDGQKDSTAVDRKGNDQQGYEALGPFRTKKANNKITIPVIFRLGERGERTAGMIPPTPKSVGLVKSRKTPTRFGLLCFHISCQCLNVCTLSPPTCTPWSFSELVSFSTLNIRPISPKFTVPRRMTPSASRFDHIFPTQRDDQEVTSNDERKAILLPQKDSENANPQHLSPLVEVSNECSQKSSAENELISTSSALPVIRYPSSGTNPFADSPETTKSVKVPSNPFCTTNTFETVSPVPALSEVSFDPDIQGDVKEMSFDPDVTDTSPHELLRKLASKIQNNKATMYAFRVITLNAHACACVRVSKCVRENARR